MTANELIGEHSVETAILAACLSSPVVAGRLLLDHQISPAHFAEPICRKTWQAITAMHDRGDVVEPAGLTAELGTGVPLPDEWVRDLLAADPAVAALPGLLDRLKRLADRRRMQRAGWLYAKAAETDDPELETKAEALLATDEETVDGYDAATLGQEACAWLASPGEPGITTGFRPLDAFLGGGLRPGDCTALGAWTSMGKSVLVDQVLAAAVTAGHTAHAYINEMSPRDRALRMLSRQTSVDVGRLMRKQLTADEAARVMHAAQNLPYGITDCSQWNAAQIARHMRHRRWGIAVLDLLHNIPYREESELHSMTATLAAAARTANTHLILVCQFNESRSIGELLPKPVIRDIRGSGMIKNLCANVLLLHRPQSDEGGFVTTGDRGTVMAGKARHGEQGRGINVRFLPEHMRFDMEPGIQAVAA